MSSLLEVAEDLVGRARPSEDVEAFVTHSRDYYVKAYAGEVEAVSSAQPRGAGIRVVTGCRVGFAYGTDLSPEGRDALVAAARDNAAHATPDDAAGLAPAWTAAPAPVEGLFEARHEEVSAQEKVEFALALDDATRSHDARVRTVEEAVYSDSDTEIAIATSTGVAGAYRRTDAWCYSIAIATDGGDTEIGFDFDVARFIGDLDAVGLGGRSAERAVAVLGAQKVPSERLPIVLDPYVAGQFLSVLAHALTGEAVQRGRSPFAGRIGERVAAGGVALVDDGRLAGAPGSAPWDGEGVSTGRTEVIADGILTSLLYDLTSARREGRDSTGNAARGGFKSRPGPAPTNLAFEPTGPSRSKLLRDAGRALLVRDFHGVHSGANPETGDFSVGVTGQLLDGGAPGRAVKEVTIAAPMLDILSGVVAVADDRRWMPFAGSFGGATTLIAEMTVAGS